MVKGCHLSAELRSIIYQRCTFGGSTAEQIFMGDLFEGDYRVITLHRLKAIVRMFNDPNRNAEAMAYLGSGRKRGNPGVQSTVETDILIANILENWPFASLDFYLAKLAEMRGSSFEDVSLKMLRASIWRCKATKKSPDFYSPLQDHLRIERHLDDMRPVHPDDICNFDQCSCSTEKYRPKSGYGVGRLIVHEWVIGVHYFSAIAALTTRGFVDCVQIKEGTFSHEDVENFVEALGCLISPGAVALFDNASINVMESTLRAVDRIFQGSWKRNV